MPTPLVVDSPVAKPPTGKSKLPVFSGMPLLGFEFLVAPVNKTARSQVPLFSGGTLPRNVHQLPRAVYACAKMAPSLYTVLRKILESQDCTNQATETFLEQNPAVKRYNSGFKLLWGILKARRGSPETSPLGQVASALQFLNTFSAPKPETPLQPCN